MKHLGCEFAMLIDLQSLHLKFVFLPIFSFTFTSEEEFDSHVEVFYRLYSQTGK